MSGSISPDEEGRLTWYLSRGQTLFQKSTFGSMMERAHMYAYALEEVPAIVDPEADFLPEGDVKRVRARNGKTKVVDGQIVYGSGTITARPTAEARVSSTHDRDDEQQSKDILRAADTDRRLASVGRASTLSRSVLELYYGDRGARYAGGRPGRLFSLYICTEAGRELLVRDLKESMERQKSGAPASTLQDHLRMENQAAEEFGRTVLAPLPDHTEGKPTPRSKRWRRLMLQASDLQARQLLANAARLWNRNG